MATTQIYAHVSIGHLKEELDIVPRNAKDNPIAAAALEGQVPYLVSRDEDLLSLKVLRMPGHRPVQIVGPRALLRLLGRV